MKLGNIIVLNGVSSAGKSTLAKALHEPYFYIAQDVFTHLLAPNYTGKYLPDDRLNPVWKRAVSAMHHTIKLYSDLGNNVIVDHVMTDWSDEYDADESFCELQKLLEGYDLIIDTHVNSIEECTKRVVTELENAQFRPKIPLL